MTRPNPDHKRPAPALPEPEPGHEWVFDPKTFEPWQRRITVETDQERKARTDLSSVRMTDDESKAVQKTPNRVSLDSMLAKVVHEEFVHPYSAPHMTICVLTIANGYYLVGKSTPADPENFNDELGKKFAREDAIRQMWSLEAYLLREKISQPTAYEHRFTADGGEEYAPIAVSEEQRIDEEAAP